jgi:hypothetical protein
MTDETKRRQPETPEEIETCFKEGADNLIVLLKGQRSGGIQAMTSLIDQLDEDTAKWTLSAAVSAIDSVMTNLSNLSENAQLAASTKDMPLN